MRPPKFSHRVTSCLISLLVFLFILALGFGLSWVAEMTLVYVVVLVFSLDTRRRQRKVVVLQHDNQSTKMYLIDLLPVSGGSSFTLPSLASFLRFFLKVTSLGQVDNLHASNI
jgi:hypothetical protein